MHSFAKATERESRRTFDKSKTADTGHQAPSDRDGQTTRRTDGSKKIPNDGHERRRDKDDYRSSGHRELSGRGVRQADGPPARGPTGRGRALTQPAWMNKTKNSSKLSQPKSDRNHDRAHDRAGDRSRDRGQERHRADERRESGHGRTNDGSSDTRHRDRPRDSDARNHGDIQRHGGGSRRERHRDGSSGGNHRDMNRQRDRGPDRASNDRPPASRGDYGHSDGRRSPPRHSQSGRRTTTTTSTPVASHSGIKPLYFLMRGESVWCGCIALRERG